MFQPQVEHVAELEDVEAECRAVADADASLVATTKFFSWDL